MLFASRQGRRAAWFCFALLLLLSPAAAPAQNASVDQLANDGDSAPRVAFSLIEGGLSPGTTDGGGIVTTAPLFVDADGPDGLPGTLDDNLRLQPGSPAIDGGDNSALPPDLADLDGDGDTTDPLAADLDGNIRVVDGGSGMARVDLGPYEHNAAPVSIKVSDDALPAAYVLTAAYPNPFNPQTTLHFGLRHATPVQIMLYDLLGRERRVLYEGTPTPGRLHPLRIDGSGLASGLYFVRLSGKDVHATQSIMLIR